MAQYGFRMHSLISHSRWVYFDRHLHKLHNQIKDTLHMFVRYFFPPYRMTITFFFARYPTLKLPFFSIKSLFPFLDLPCKIKNKFDLQ